MQEQDFEFLLKGYFMMTVNKLSCNNRATIYQPGINEHQWAFHLITTEMLHFSSHYELFTSKKLKSKSL